MSIFDKLHRHALLHIRPLSETQSQALEDMQSIWLKFASFTSSLKDAVDICEVQAACQIISSHYPRPAYQTIAAIEGGNIPLINEFFDALSTLPTTQGKLDAIQRVRAAWMEYLSPPKVAYTMAEIVELTRKWSLE